MRRRAAVIVSAVVPLGLMWGLCGCGGGGSEARPLVVHMDDNTFVPQQLELAPGQIVRFQNEGTTRHGVVADPDATTPGGPDSTARYPGGIPVGRGYTWRVPDSIVPGTHWYYHEANLGTPGDGTRLGIGMVGKALVY